MEVKIELLGSSPLLMCNISLADPDNQWAREISTYTKKRVKTEDDRREIERLEWFGGLYTEDGRGVIYPTANIRRCFIEAGKISKQGTQVGRALSFMELNTTLHFDGPKDVQALSKLPEFRDRSAVGVSGKRVMRVRPKFPDWGIVATAYLLEDVMDPEDLRRVATRAGQAIGLGDNRINGYGRFTAVIT